MAFHTPTPPADRLRLWHTLRRWIRNPLLRAYEFRFFALFWQVRHKWRGVKFWLARRGYSALHGFRTTTQSASIVLLITRTVFWQVLAAALLVTVVEFLNQILRTNLASFKQLVLHSVRPHVILVWLSNNLPEPSLSVGTLSTLAQISGLFLGLYFTAISVVAGSNYARVPTEILDALVREKVGNLYIRIVALFGGISLILLGATNVGYHPGILNLILVLLLGIASVFSFVELGRRAFYFFDPTQLVKSVAGEILQSVRSVTWNGFGWRDSAFQNYYRQQADNNVRIYEDVILFPDKEHRLQGRSLLTLIYQLLALLQIYAEEKKRIPSESLWFERIYQHRSWLTTDDSRVSLAIQTGTGLDPENVPDQLWFEKRIGNLISRTLNGLRDGGDFARAVSVSLSLQETLGTLSKECAIQESLSLLARLKMFAHEVAMKTKIDIDTSSNQESVLAPSLGLSDVCGGGFISILLGFASAVEAIAVEAFSAAIDKVDFQKPKTIYQTGLPRKVIGQLEFIQKGIAFEVQVERRQISPDWYCRQIAALGMARFVVDTCDALLTELEHSYATEAEDLCTNSKPLFAAQVVQRGLEACHKFHVHAEKLQEWFKSFSVLRQVTDIPWPQFDAKKIHEQIGAVHDRLLIVIGNSISGIASVPPSKEIPDYLGQAYVMLADECYNSMAGGDEALFGKLFRPFFAVSIAAQDRLRVQLKDYDPKNAIIYITEPIEDLLAISGYALIYSELDNKSYWSLVKTCWDKYFAMLPAPAPAVKHLIDTISYRRSLFAILPRDIQRTAWTQDFIRRLRERGLSEDFFASGMRRREPSHPSAIIRTLSRGHYSFERAADIFTACYLMERPEAAGVEVPASVRDFGVRVSRERKRVEPDDEASNESFDET